MPETEKFPDCRYDIIQKTELAIENIILIDRIGKPESYQTPNHHGDRTFSIGLFHLYKIV